MPVTALGGRLSRALRGHGPRGSVRGGVAWGVAWHTVLAHDLPRGRKRTGEPWEYGTRYAIFSDMRVIHGTVEVDRGELIEIFVPDTPPDIVDDMIEYFKSRQEQ